MDTQIRAVTEDEFTAYCRTTFLGFGGLPTPKEIEDLRPTVELDRTVAAFDGKEIVGTAGAYTFLEAVPGGESVPVAGVTAVGVRTTHRRRGLLRAMMEFQLDDVASRGEPVAILTASESVIYGRFGYGHATNEAFVSIERAYAEFARTLDDAGSIELLEPEQARKILPPLHEQIRKGLPGDITRSDAWWDYAVKDPEYNRRGSSAMIRAVHKSATGKADGWVTYRMRPGWKDGGLPNMKVEVSDLGATNTVAEIALWQYVLDIDLATEVVTYGRPVDEPLRYWLADPRRLRTTAIKDDVWVRILDVPAALAARRYELDGEVVVEVEDRFRPQTSGRYLLTGGPDEAACVRTKKKADLRLGIAELGSAYLGWPRFRTQARAGLVEEVRPGALRLADQMFGASTVPFCRTGF